MLTRVYDVSNQPEFEIDVSCQVWMTASDRDDVYIEATGSEQLLEDLEVYQEDDGTIVIHQKNIGNNFSVGNIYQSGGGVSVSQVNGVTYINGGNVVVGEVFVNGKRADMGSGNYEPEEPVKIKIYSPGIPSVKLDTTGSANFIADLPLATASVDCQGSARVAIVAVDDLDLDISGSAKVKVQQMTGSLSIDASGSANLEFNGEYSKVDIDAAGSAKITTRGTCHGNYKVDAAGVCQITHQGTVLGKVRKSTSGCSTVNV